MGTASKTKEDAVKGRSGAHALLSRPSIGGQELIICRTGAKGSCRS